MVPLMTSTEVIQSSFSRFGLPRERIWYERRIVALDVLRQDRNALASASLEGTGFVAREKKPGSEFWYTLANAGEATHSRNVFAAARFLPCAFRPSAWSGWSLM